MIFSFLISSTFLAYIKGSSIMDPLSRFGYDLLLTVPLFLLSLFVFCILFFTAINMSFIKSFMKKWEINSQNRNKNILINFVHRLRRITFSAPLLFTSILIFGIGLINDVWYHDHFGLDGFWSPMHWSSYVLMPIIVIILFGASVQLFAKQKKIIFLIWFGGWLATVAMVTNFIWHGFDLVETFAAPPHVIFFPALFLMLFPFLSLYLTHDKKVGPITKVKKLQRNITLFLCYIAILTLVLALMHWVNHAEDIGLTGLVSLVTDFTIKHPAADVKPALEQIDALRKVAPLLIPVAYAILFSFLAASALRVRLFRGALTLMFLLDFVFISLYHFEIQYVPVIIFPFVALEISRSLYRRVQKSTVFPLWIAFFVSTVFYLFYYPYTFFVGGIHWPLFAIGEVMLATFATAVIVSTLVVLGLGKEYG